LRAYRAVILEKKPENTITGWKLTKTAACTFIIVMTACTASTKVIHDRDAEQKRAQTTSTMCTICRVYSAYTLGQVGLHIGRPREVEDAVFTEESIPEGWQCVEAVHRACSLGWEGWKRRNRRNQLSYGLLTLEVSCLGL
jgi:hypothetical protein